MEHLIGKRVLFLAPSFFGYEHVIVSELTKFGAVVKHYDERPFSSSLSKVLNRLNLKFFIRKSIVSHFNSIVNVAKVEPFDYLFVIAPETMDANFVRSLKLTNPNMKSILYMWDSIKNKSNAQKVLRFFDHVFTFDKTDKDFAPGIEFLPLFYPDNFAEKARCQKAPSEMQYAACFIGSAHSDRAKVVKKISAEFEKRGLRTFVFLFCPGKLYFWLRKIFTNEYTGLSMQDLSFSSLSKQEMQDVLDNSNIVIDIQHPGQTGLTMRTIEMLGYGKKLVTTNREVASYDFYDPNNIAVVDRNTPVLADDFIASTYQPPECSVVLDYSMSAWLGKIFAE